MSPEIQAMINALLDQRNNALNQFVESMGKIAVRDEKIKLLDDEIAELKKEIFKLNLRSPHSNGDLSE